MHSHGRHLGITAIIFILTLLSISAAPVQIGGTQRNGTISGRILLPDGSPAVGMRVAAMAALSDRPPNFTNASTTLLSLTPTDADGKYVLTEVPPGRYFVVAGPFDDLAYFPGVMAPSKATTLIVADGGALNIGDFSLSVPPVFGVRGRVIREANTYSPDVALTDETGAVSLTTRIAPDGSFAFPRVRSGAYQAWVGCFSPVGIVVGREITDLEIVIPPPAAMQVANVQFTATVEGGGPLPQLELRIMPRSCPARFAQAMFITLFSERLSTENALSVAIDQRIPVGEYAVSSVAPLPEGYSVKSIMAGATDLLMQPLIVMAAGVPPIAVTLGASKPPPWVRVKGRIAHIDEAKFPPREITIQEEDSPLRSFRAGSFLLPTLTVPVLPDGAFEFPMVRTGTYEVRLGPIPDDFNRRLTVSNTDGDVVNVEFPAIPALKQISGRIQGIPLSAERLATVHVELRRLSSAVVNTIAFVNGVWISRGEPPVCRLCTLRDTPPAIGTVRSSAVAADGSFTFDAVEARFYELDLLDCSPGSCVMVRDAFLAITDNDIGGLVLTSNRPVATAGRIVVEGGAAAPNIAVFLSAVKSQSTSDSVTGLASKGSFSLTALEGEYDLYLGSLPLGYVVTSITRGRADLRSQPLKVSAVDRDEVVIHMALDPKDWATVSGRVTGVDPRQGPIRLVLRGGEPGLTLETEVNTEGAFRISGVPQGKYDLSLEGAVIRSVADALYIVEIIGGGPHKAEDVEGLEIVVPPSADADAVLRMKDP